MSFSLFEEDLDKITGPSIALEFFHNFTLIHDDIMDNADMRRGKVTIHKKWDQNIGILSGDLLIIFALKMLEDIEEESFKKTFKRLLDKLKIKVLEKILSVKLYPSFLLFMSNPDFNFIYLIKKN